MKIYEIDAAIDALMADVDEETGEINFDLEALESLQMERDRAIENLALYYKNVCAEAAAVKTEEDKLKKRREVLTRKAERLENFIQSILRGEKFKSARVVISYRPSKKLVLSEGWTEWAATNAPDFLKYSNPVPDKKLITEAIKSGQEIKGAELVDSDNIQIK